MNFYWSKGNVQGDANVNGNIDTGRGFMVR